MEPKDVTYFPAPRDFRDWLQAHHAERDELWVGYWKKATGKKSVTWPETVDEALCFGWIDGIRRRLSEEAYAVRFTPRRRGSTWSARNLQRYQDLEGQDRVTPAGRQAFKARGEEKAETYSYEKARPSTLPDDYLEEMESNDGAWSEWQRRPPSYQKKVIHWIVSGKQEATRKRRLAKLIDDLAAGRA